MADIMQSIMSDPMVKSTIAVGAIGSASQIGAAQGDAELARCKAEKAIAKLQQEQVEVQVGQAKRRIDDENSDKEIQRLADDIESLKGQIQDCDDEAVKDKLGVLLGKTYDSYIKAIEKRHGLSS